MASIPCNFEINVAKKATDKVSYHFCRIEIPEVIESEARKKLELIRRIFGDDYNVSMTFWNCYGKPIE